MKKQLYTLIFQLLLANIVMGQYSFTTVGQTYTQDFETFAGTAGSIPPNWTNSFNDYLPGGYYSNTGTYSNQLSTYALNQDGTSEYSIGSKIGATGGVQILTFSAVNNVVGQIITDFTVSWDVEQYSTGGRATTNNFSFSVSGGTITGATISTAITGSNANLASVIVTNRNITISGLNIQFGSTFNFVWTTTTGATTGDNAHIGLDNVSIVLSSTVLPIELTSFNARAINQQSTLNWSTQTERDNNYFSIERGDNITRFEEIGQVKGAGDSNEPQHYSFTDKTPLPGKNYYRLRQVDFDGTFSYSPMVSVNFGDEGGITLSPVPIRDQLRVQLEKANQEDGTWQIIDMNGRILRSGVFPAESTEYQINASDLPEGSYVFRLVAGRAVWVRRF